MEAIKKEIERLSEISNGINPKNWDRIYAWNTENLNTVFKNINIKDKTVFSVLSSSDILFHLLINNAKNVDTFDINPLTHRYYYLRKWLLEYGHINACGLDIKEMNEIVNNHSETESSYERETILFWKKYMNNLIDKYYDREFMFFFYKDPLFITPNTIYRYQYDKEFIERLSKRLNENPLEFNELDILSKEKLECQKYDVVYLSNILDYASSEGVFNAANKICDILNNNGYIICVNMFNESFINQRSIFNEKFGYEEISTEFVGVAGAPIKYYRYMKR